jgi:hypothetical protein
MECECEEESSRRPQSCCRDNYRKSVGAVERVGSVTLTCTVQVPAVELRLALSTNLKESSDDTTNSITIDFSEIPSSQRELSAIPARSHQQHSLPPLTFTRRFLHSHSGQHRNCLLLLSCIVYRLFLFANDHNVTPVLRFHTGTNEPSGCSEYTGRFRY